MSKKRIAALSLAAAMIGGTLAGCGSKVTTLDLENPTITILCSQADVESATPESPVWQALEEYLGVKLDISWVPASSYGEKMTATLGSGNYPMIMLIESRSSSIIQNCRAGTFWEVGEKIKDASKYPNLSQSNDIVLNNISIDGKVYGIYRARTLGRNGVSIRTDWLENLGMKMPTTIDEFYEVLKAFKNNDPDGNGQNDTFGIIMTTASTSFDNLAVWFGAPNKYAVDEEGNVTPDFLTDEYFEAMKFVKKLYDEQLVNQDLATYDGTKWDEQFLNNKAGVIIDVADRARRLATNIAETNPDAEVGVFGYLKKDAASEIRTLPTTGYAGWFAFPKKALPNEEDIDFVLGIMDKMNNAEAVNLMNYGIEGRQYEIVDGFAEVTSDKTLTKEFGDLNKLSTAVVSNVGLTKAYANKTAEEVERVYRDNEQYAVANPAEAFVSDTYSKKGPQLDAIISEARTRFIVGQINEEQWKSELERWKNNGGNDVIKEISDQYKDVYVK